MSSLATGTGDEYLIAWIMNWNIYALLNSPIAIFNANLFYPFGNSLAFSDTHFISSILSILPVLLVGEPIVATNITIISSFVFVGFCTYLLAHHLIKNIFTAVFCGLIIIFSPAFLDKLVHVQVLAIQWVPLSLLFFVLFLESRKDRFLALALIFFVIQTYNSFLPGYFILLSFLVFTVVYCLKNKYPVKKLFTKRRLFIVLLSLLLLIPVATPYYRVSKDYVYTRDIRDAVHLALQPEDLFYASSYSRLAPVINQFTGPKVFPNGDFKPGFVGGAFTLLTVVVLIDFLKNFRKRRWEYGALIVTGLSGLILSLGPALHLGRQTIHVPFIIPLPYAVLYYVVPGFQGMRNSFRWEMLFVLMMAVAIGIFLAEVTREMSTMKRKTLLIVLSLLVIAEFNFPIPFITVPKKNEFPPVYHWVGKTEKNAVIIEMPVYNWNMYPYAGRELLRNYYATAHFRKTVNGASGFSPPPWQELVTSFASEFPDTKSIQRMKQIGIQYIIVHADEYDIIHAGEFTVNTKRIPDGKQVLYQLDQNSATRLKKRFGRDFVYEIL